MLCTGLVLGTLLAAFGSLASAADPILYNETSRFTFIDIPTPAAGPCDMANGADGYLYVQYLFAEKIAKVDYASNTIIEQYDIPFTGPKLSAPIPLAKGLALGACVLRSGADGNIYAANGVRNQLAKLDLATKKVTVFTPPNADQPVGNLQPFNDMWGASEGMYYSQSSANIINLFDYYTHEFKQYNVPTPASLPLGMRKAYDNALWFTELAGQKIARLNHTSGQITEYTLPVPSLLGPAVLRVETAGRYIWFTGALSNSIGRLDIYTHQFTAYPNTGPPDPVAVPSEDTLDDQGNLWYCTWTQNFIHSLDTTTGSQVHIAIPAGPNQPYAPQPYDIGLGINYYGLNGKRRIYFTQSLINRMGFYDLDA